MPTFTIDTRINAPIARCFDMARSVDLHMRSSDVPERAVAGKTSGLLDLDNEVTWEARHLWRMRRLSSRIVAMNCPKSFAVEMTKGPFASHTHEFTFTAVGNEATVMHEVFQFQSPFGVIGRITDALVLTRYLRRFMLARNTFLKEQAESTNEASIRTGIPSSEQFEFRAPRRPLGHWEAIVVAGEGRISIDRDPRDILEFVLDVDRYRRADHKIGKVRSWQRDGNSGRVRHDGRFLGIRAPAATLSFELTPDSRLDFRGEAMPWPIRSFDGFFTLPEVAEWYAGGPPRGFHDGPDCRPADRADAQGLAVTGHAGGSPPHEAPA